MRLLALCCVGRTNLILDVAPLRLRSNRLAALPQGPLCYLCVDPKTKIRTARARIRWRILAYHQRPTVLLSDRQREHIARLRQRMVAGPAQVGVGARWCIAGNVLNDLQ